jgi:general secretion pathway protein J
MSLFLNKTHILPSSHPLFPERGHGEVILTKRGLGESNGFTLLEVLIAVTIISIVLVAIYSTFILSHRAVEGMDESLLKNQESRKAIDILKRELDATVYRGDNALTFLKIQDRDIYGKQAAQLTFTTFSPLLPGLSKISYYIEEKDGTLSLFKKVSSPYSSEDVEGIDIIEGLESFTVEAQYNGSWVKTWDTDINKNIPDEIRISLSIIVKGSAVTFFDVSQPRIGKTLST